MDNVGGLAKLYICPVGNLTVGGTIVDQAKLIPIPFIPDTGSRKCTRKMDKTGEYYDLTIECTIARADSDALIRDVLPIDFAAVSVDGNGVARLDGNYREPIKYEYESDSGEKFEDLSGVHFKFSRKLRFSSPIVTL